MPAGASPLRPIGLRLRLVGVPQLLAGDRPAHPGSRKAMALLALLALDGEASREHLAALLWPDQEAAAARRNLRRELFRLREQGVALAEGASGALSFKIRGTVSALNTTAKTFQIGSAVINYATLASADLPANLANGQVVRVKVKPQQENGQWIATSVRSGERKVDDHDDGRLVGQVTGFRSATDFDVNGVKVDASAARIDNGPVKADSRVEVRGKVSAGTLVAERVKVLDGSDDMIRGVELHGTIGSLNTGAKTFVVRGVTVSYAGSVTYERGSEAQLANNQPVEVKGALASDGTTLNATLIRFED